MTELRLTDQRPGRAVDPRSRSKDRFLDEEGSRRGFCWTLISDRNREEKREEVHSFEWNLHFTKFEGFPPAAHYLLKAVVLNHKQPGNL